MTKMPEIHEEQISEYLENTGLFSITMRVRGSDYLETLGYIPFMEKMKLVGDGNGTINGRRELENTLLSFKKDLGAKVISDHVNDETKERIIKYSLPQEGDNPSKPVEIKIKRIGEFVDMSGFKKYIKSEGGFA